MFTSLVANLGAQSLLARAAGCCASRCLQVANHLSTASFGCQQNKQDPASVVKATISQPATQKGEVKELQELRTDRPLLYPDQMEWLDERLVRISRPTKNVMQSGTAYTNCWKIEFNSEPRYEYWLIGWTSTNDPVSNLSLNFPTKEAAIAFCERNKLQWFVEEQPNRKIRRKSYADNFSWNKRTRLGSK